MLIEWNLQVRNPMRDENSQGKWESGGGVNRSCNTENGRRNFVLPERASAIRNVYAICIQR